MLAGAAVTVAISTLLLLLAPTCAFSATTKARALVENLVHDEQCYLTDVRPKILFC